MKKYSRNTKVMILVILVLAVSIGFAALSTTLKINGDAIVHGGKWDIYWDNVEVADGSVESEIPEINVDDEENPRTKVSWDVLLEEPGDYYEFTVDAVNNGSIDAVITDIESTVTPELPEFINYTVTYDDNTAIRVYDPLNKKNGNTPTTKKYKVRIEFSTSATEEQLDDMPDEGYVFEFEYDVTYGQASVYDSTKKEIVSLKTSDGTPIASLDDEEIIGKIGSDVDYKTMYPIDWQLFYADEDYVYLITKSYVPHKYLPSELYKDTHSNYDVGFTSDDFTISNILPDARWSSGMASAAIQNNPLKNKYLKWANAYPTSNNNNAIATAYMMDTNVWANFAGNAKGAFAIGGPTLELLIQSYNTGNLTHFETYDEINNVNSNSFGYNAKRVDENAYSYYWNDGAADKLFYPYWSETPNMWDPSERSNDIYDYVKSYFIASPGHRDANCLPIIGYGGELYHGNSQSIPVSNSGMRPVVAIPRSSLK